MDNSQPLFEISPVLDRADLARRYSQAGRVQIRDVLTSGTAAAVRHVLEAETPWGLAWAAPDQKASNIRAEAMGSLAPDARLAIGRQVSEAAERGKFAFLYGQYPMLDAYLEKWDPGHPLDLLLEHINDAPMLNLVRDVTGVPELIKADAQATLYAPGHFLAAHDDSHATEGRRVAYVLSLAQEWRPDWGGYLLFYDADGDVVSGFKPRYNTLNLFAVPQQHNVSYVPPFAPVGRFAVTGWFRDR